MSKGLRAIMSAHSFKDPHAKRSPVLLDILQTCQNHLESIKGSVPADVSEAVEKILDVCDEKARKLREIFEKVLAPGSISLSQPISCSMYSRISLP
jgi:hypothetical protein